MLKALPQQVARFLDLATGDGRLLALVRRHHPDAKTIGLDSSAPRLDRAKGRFSDDPLIELHEHDLRGRLWKSGRLTSSYRGLRSIIWKTSASESCSGKYTLCSCRAGLRELDLARSVGDQATACRPPERNATLDRAPAPTRPSSSLHWRHEPLSDLRGGDLAARALRLSRGDVSAR
jgi:hypothetical protein